MMVLAGGKLRIEVAPVEIYKEAPCGASERRHKPPQERSSGENEIAKA
jgi:hypothetical protein